MRLGVGIISVKSDFIHSSNIVSGRLYHGCTDTIMAPAKSPIINH